MMDNPHMTVRLSIGDFSRMTHLSVKALRHYHDVGLLVPAEVDRGSGYRYYQPDQVALAQVIRRFRDLGMPLEDIRAVLQAPDVEARNEVIVGYLDQVHDQLARTQATVDSLRSLLAPQAAPVPVEYRAVPPQPALELRALQLRLARLHPADVAADGVDLAVVRDAPEGVGERPGRKCVRGEPGMG